MTKSRMNIGSADVLIIGGGPAGLSALLWCKELGMSAVLIEKNAEFGGQLLSIHNPITNYLGRTAANGREMLGHFISQIDILDKSSVLNGSVVEFDVAKITAALSTGESVSARAAIIATGIRRRRLNVLGEKEFEGRGILESGARDKRSVMGRRVAIVGGGDAALENALILAEFAEKVYVIHRRSEFSARPEFVGRAVKIPKIEFVFNSTVNRFLGNEQMSAVSLSTPSGELLVDVDAALIRIGVQPNSEIFAGQLDLDAASYIKVDHLGATNAPNVFAAGDVANPVSPTISTAVGTAVTAAQTAFSYLISSPNSCS